MTGKPHTTVLKYEERKLIQKYINQGFSCSQIAGKIGRGKNSIVVEVRRSGGQDKYCAKNAQKLCDERLAAKYEKMKGKKGNLPNYPNNVEIYEKLKKFEMQMDIIYDTLKELLKK